MATSAAPRTPHPACPAAVPRLPGRRSSRTACFAQGTQLLRCAKWKSATAPSRRRHVACAASSSADNEPVAQEPASLAVSWVGSSLAPLEPETGTGAFLLTLLADRPDLFDAALAEQIARLSATEEDDNDASVPDSPDPAMGLLARRIAAIRTSDRTRAVEELLYCMVVRSMSSAGAPMLPRLVDAAALATARPARAEALLSVHAVASRACVREHVGAVTAGMPDASRLSLPLAGVASLYASSATFGYALRSLHARWSLERRVGVGGSGDDAAIVASDMNIPEARLRLERLLLSAPGDQSTPIKTPWESLPGEALAPMPPPPEDEGASLKRYVTNLPPGVVAAAMQARTLPARGALDRQAAALFGRPLSMLVADMRSVVGDVDSAEQLNAVMSRCMADGTLPSILLSPAAVVRVCLEGSAFGALLADAEHEFEATHA